MTQFEPFPEGIALPSHLGRRILEIMEEKGKAFTIQAVSIRIGMNRKTLSAKLHGDRDLYMFELRRLAECFKLPIDRITQDDVRDDEKELKSLFEAFSNPARALEVAEKLASLAVGASERSYSQNNLGRAYFFLQRYDMAHQAWLEAYQYAKVQAEKYNETTPLFNVTANLMISFTIRKEYSSLTDLLAVVEPIFHDNPERSSIICYSLAKIAENKGDIEKAREQYYKSLGLYLRTDHKNSIAKSRHNTACFEYRQRNYQLARTLFENALEDLLDDQYAYLLCIKEYAKTLIKINENSKAKELLMMGLDKLKPCTSKQYLDLMAKYFLILARSVDDVSYADQVLDMEDVDKNLKEIACKYLIEYYDQQGDLSLVVKYYRIVRNLSHKGYEILDEEAL